MSLSLFLPSFFSLTSSICLFIPLPFLSCFLPLFYHSRPPLYHSFPLLKPSFQSLPSSICPCFPSVPPFYHPSDISLLQMHPQCGKEESKRGGIEKRKKDARKHKRKSLSLKSQHICHFRIYTSRTRNAALFFGVFFNIFTARCCVLISQIYVLQAIVAQHGGAVGLIITSKLVRDKNEYKILYKS